MYVISEQAGSVVSSLAAIVTFVSLCAALWPISPWAGIAVALALVPSLISFSWAAAMQQREWPKVSRIRRRITYLLEQLVQQRTGGEISANGSGPRVASLVDGHQRRADRVEDRIFAGLQWGTMFGGVLSALLLAVALVLIVAGGGGSGGVAAGVLGVLAGIQATRGSGYSLGLVQQGSPKVQVYRDLIDELPLDDPLPVIHRADALQLAEVTVRYPHTDRVALVGTDLTVRRGEVVALVGSNGAGKTTLVRAIMGSVTRESGTVTIDGADASSMSTAQLTAHFGLLTQEFGRYEVTVRQALSLGVPGNSEVPDDQLWAALRTAHLDDVVADLPDGLDTQIGEQFDGVGLSGGQWQRLALARTALRDAAIWILDEPTSAVDAETEREIFTELLAARHDRITIVVSHRAWTLRGMDRILVLDHGRIVQTGRYEELAREPGRFAELFAEQ